MTLDSEQQRKFLLEMIKGVNFPGAVLEDAYELKTAITKATVGKPAHLRAVGVMDPEQGDTP